MKMVMDYWNINTQLWLKRICYTRLPKMKTLGVFILSAAWHGFYPGLYFTFISAAVCVYAGRVVSHYRQLQIAPTPQETYFSRFVVIFDPYSRKTK